MATYREIIGGLMLLASCEKNGWDAHGIQAEHDELYAGPAIADVPPEVGAKLEALGWHITDADCWGRFT